MGKKSGPSAPDPAATIAAQKDANQVTQLTPTGNIRYGSVDASGVFTPKANSDAVQVEESPFSKQIREMGQGLALNLGGQVGGNLQKFMPVNSNTGAFNGDPNSLKRGLTDFHNIDTSSLPDLNTDFGAQSKQAQDATYQSGLALMQPQMDLERRRTQQQLADQGLPIGSEASNGELNRMDSNQGNQLNQLALQSVLAGNQEQGRLFGQTSQARGQLFGEQGTIADQAAQQRQQQYGENQGVFNAGLAKSQYDFNRGISTSNQAAQQRQQQFGEIGSLLGMQGTPQAVNVPGVDAAGIIQNATALNQQQAANRNAAYGQLLQTGGALGAAAIMSDIRTKENIIPVGISNGHNLYEFNYIGTPERYVGVMAQEVEKTHPEAVIEINGIKHVCYESINVPFWRVN